MPEWLQRAMLVFRTANGVETYYRQAEFGSSAIPAWSRVSGRLSHSDKLVTTDEAAGLPAVGAAIRLISETIAMLPLNVYRGQMADKRLAQGWQWELLHDHPNPDQSAFEFWQDVAAMVESTGNAFIRKVKSRPIRRVDELYLMSDSHVLAKRDRGVKVFEVYGPRGEKELLTSTDVLHIKGFTIRGGEMGLTPIQLHRHRLGSALSMEEFEGRFYANDASPGVVIEVPGPPNREHAKQLQEYWESTHGGARNAHRPAILFGDAKMHPYGISLKDAEFVASQRYGVEQVALMYGIPKALMGLEGPTGNPEQDMIRFLNFGLQGRLARIERTLAADTDLFGADNPYPEFDVSRLIRLDAATKAEVYHKQVQAGIITPDEARADEGRPPLPDGAGKVPQQTPVGGAPNPSSNGATPELEDEEEEPRQLVVVIPEREVHNHVDARTNVEVPEREMHVDARTSVDVPEREVHNHVDARTEVEVPERETRVEPVINVPEREVHVSTPDVTVEAPTVNIPDNTEEIRRLAAEASKRPNRRFKRDKDGFITAVVEDGRTTRVRRDRGGNITELVAEE